MGRDRHDDDAGVAEPVAKGLLRAWLAAKLLPLFVRLATWAAWLGAVGAYAGFVVWRVRRLVKKGALEDRAGPPAPVSARERGILAYVRGDGIDRSPPQSSATDRPADAPGTGRP